MSVRLFVGNLPYQATEDDVRTHFSAVVPPTRVAIPVDRETGRPRGFAFVEFDSPAQAQEAIQRFNGQPFMGRNLAVNEARAREDRGPGGPGMRPPMGSRPPMGGSGGGPGARGGDAPGGAPGGREFGPPARRSTRAGGSPRKDREESKPRGPIPVRYTGRVFDVEDAGDTADTVEDLGDFDDFATSRPDEKPDDKPDEKPGDTPEGED